MKVLRYLAKRELLLTLAVTALGVSLCSPPAIADGPALPEWRFAERYTKDQLMASDQAAREFLDDFLLGEAEFFQQARHPVSGLTYDGWDLDPKTGLPSQVRSFSAASKESLDLALLTKALLKDPLISRVVSPDDPSKAADIAADILAQKIKSYQQYREAYPGFAGYMAWFSSGTEAKPMKGWDKAFPTLDLGEMIWALKLTERALRQTEHEDTALAYASFNASMVDNARRAMFSKEKVGVRGRVEVSDPLSSSPIYSGDGIMTGEHGVHEGQMIVLFMSLYGGLTPEESAQVWKDISMIRVEHPAGTTWQGFWGSPHEEWAYLFLPYRDLPQYAQLFRIREKIRTQNAAQRGYPGFGASAHHPLGKGYMGAVGIEGIGSQPLEHQDTYTPYGAFPLLLQFAGQEKGNVGLVWLHNMLLGPRMQGPYGAGESGANDGTGVAPIKTIDASLTTLLALSGGLDKETAAMLKEDGKYEPFLAIMRGEYDEAFGASPLLEPTDFALPKGPAPAALSPYPTPHK